MGDITGVSSTLRDVRAREVYFDSLKGGARKFAVDIPVVGVGEVISQVWFPSLYVEKPLHAWGFEAIGNQNIPEGQTPFATVMIRSWNIKTVEDSGVKLYEGCRIATRIFSPTFTEESGLFSSFSFNVFFEGKSITMPGVG